MQKIAECHCDANCGTEIWKDGNSVWFKDVLEPELIEITSMDGNMVNGRYSVLPRIERIIRRAMGLEVDVPEYPRVRESIPMGKFVPVMNHELQTELNWFKQAGENVTWLEQCLGNEDDRLGEELISHIKNLMKLAGGE